MFGLGWQELLIILVIALIIFGPRKLPEIGKSLGQAINGFKESTKKLLMKSKKNLKILTAVLHQTMTAII